MKMKRIWTFGLVVFLTGVLAAQNVKSLYIYHTNDMHSRVEPFSDTFADTLLAGKAGMARRAASCSKNVRNTKTCCCLMQVTSRRELRFIICLRERLKSV